MIDAFFHSSFCSNLLEPLFDDFIRKVSTWPPKPYGNAPHVITAETLFFKRKNEIKELCKSNEFQSITDQTYKMVSLELE